MIKRQQYLSLLIALIVTLGIAGVVNAKADEPYYVFVIFETTVTKSNVETSDSNPSERRFYISNVVAIPSRDRSLLRKAKPSADEYFTAAVVEPLKAKGISHQYYDDGIRINNDVVYALDTRAEVEDLQKKVVEELKEQSANVFTFTWIYGEKMKGLETSRPILVHHEPGKPLYDVTEPKLSMPASKPPVKKPVRN